MFIDKEEFEKWMRRILEKLDILESKITKKKKTRYTVNGELLYDNQDICVMMNVSKRTLQRFRSSGRLPYRRIDQKTFYLESDVRNFIQEHMKSLKIKPKDDNETETDNG
ncbi:MAG: helix-turn-helix domain-containing protein [Bacteroidales bacterium]|jgi:hypothetical protein|nr:helix-turn-helix domain-containing protein [Bacteroidales bacterium]